MMMLEITCYDATTTCDDAWDTWADDDDATTYDDNDVAWDSEDQANEVARKKAMTTTAMTRFTARCGDTVQSDNKIRKIYDYDQQ